MVLTQKQRTDLHTSMVEYMLSQGEAFAAAAEALRTAAGVGEDVSAPAAVLAAPSAGGEPADPSKGSMPP